MTILSLPYNIENMDVILTPLFLVLLTHDAEETSIHLVSKKQCLTSVKQSCVYFMAKQVLSKQVYLERRGVKCDTLCV
jgi:hypothetical protein